MIIVSPAKTLNDNVGENTILDANFINKTNLLLNNIKKLSKDELANNLKIKSNTLNKTFNYYNEFEEATSLPAIIKYEGIVFKQIEDIKNILADEYKYNYVKDNVHILSTFYGIISAACNIKSYRLDFSHTKIIKESLYKFWKDDVTNYITSINPNQILNLASNEYFKIIDKDILNNYDVINIIPKQKVSSTILKKIRGEILNYCIHNKIEDYSKLVGIKTKTITITSCKNNNLKFKLN